MKVNLTLLLITARNHLIIHIGAILTKHSYLITESDRLLQMITDLEQCAAPVIYLKAGNTRIQLRSESHGILLLQPWSLNIHNHLAASVRSSATQPHRRSILKYIPYVTHTLYDIHVIRPPCCYSISAFVEK